jgi:hypothetical protein
MELNADNDTKNTWKANVKSTSSREAILSWSPELPVAIALHRVFGSVLI